MVGGVAYDPTPPPLSPGERKEIDELLAHADAMALQFRFHIPSDEPEKIFGFMRRVIPNGPRSRGEPACRGLEVELCTLGGRELMVIHRDGKAAIFDLFIFSGRYDAPAEAKTATVKAAIKAKEAKLPALKQMAGHGSLYIDGERVVEMHEHDRVAATTRGLVGGYESPQNHVKRRLDDAKALRRLLDAPRLFDGMLLNATYDRDRIQLQMTWPLREGQQELANKTLAPPKIVVPVPTLDALCEGSLACMRSRGIPNPQEMGTSLALGVYADPGQLEDAIDEADERAALLLLASTWPNALATVAWQLPQQEARGAEGAIVRGVLP